MTIIYMTDEKYILVPFLRGNYISVFSLYLVVDGILNIIKLAYRLSVYLA
jgi:hypothetical protein